MPSVPLHTLPDGYTQIKGVTLTESRLLLWLNLFSLLPLGGMIAWMAFWWGLAARWRAPQPGETVYIPWLLGLIIVFVVVLPLHEFLHGLAIHYFGHRVRYGAKLSKGVLYATAENALFRRNEYLAVALAPFVGVTLLVMLLMLVAPSWLAFHAALAAVVNAGGAVGDLWSAWVVRRYPASALVRDTADGFQVYVPV